MKLPGAKTALQATLGAALLTTVPTRAAMGLGFSGVPDLLRHLPEASRTIEIHPYKAPNLGDDGASFSLFGRGAITFRDAVARALRNGGLVHPLLEMRATTVQGFGLAGGGESVDYRFFVNGVPLCDYQVRAHELQMKSMLVLGRIPVIDPYEPAPARDWPDLALTLDNVTASVVESTNARRVDLAARRERCLLVRDGRLLPMWSLDVRADGLPYKVLADAYETVRLSPGYFDADGSARVYPKNRLDAELVTTPLTGLTGDGTLSSTYLRTVVPGGYTAAKEPTNVFAYPPTDLRFDEVQVYAQAQTHFDFFKSIGFEWYGPTPLDIKIHIAPGGRPNNALFIPGSSADGSRPSISIHDGDGIDLQNLVSDGDVVSHEFGHHVIYKTLQSTQGESLVLHEGLADFFAFSRTGDACLGESICPRGSGACIIEGQCLRTAANGLVYNDKLWNEWAGSKYRLGHLHGQLVSGLLWDLATKHAVEATDLARLTLTAVSYFKYDSGLRDLMLALFTADLELFGGKYAQAIQSAGSERGLATLIDDVVPGQPIPPLEGVAGAVASTPPGAPTAEKNEKQGDDNPFKCGTIAYDSGKTSRVLLLLLMALPITLFVAPMPARARSPLTSKARRRPR